MNAALTPVKMVLYVLMESIDTHVHVKLDLLVSHVKEVSTLSILSVFPFFFFLYLFK